MSMTASNFNNVAKLNKTNNNNNNNDVDKNENNKVGLGVGNNLVNGDANSRNNISSIRSSSLGGKTRAQLLE
jgi:adenine specific DNA methylase Mod